MRGNSNDPGSVRGSAPALPPDPRCDPWHIRSAKIVRVCRETADVNTYDIRIEDQSSDDRFRFLPGQFNMLYVPGVGEAAISISGSTAGGEIRHTVRDVGNVTGALSDGGVGMSLGIRGPFGTPWPIASLVKADSPVDLIVVAGGIGIAPLCSAVEYVMEHRDRFGRVDLLLGARTPSDLLFTTRFSNWAKHDIRISSTVDRADATWNGHIGVVTQLLDRLVIPRPDQTMLMMCGPEIMMRFVVQSAGTLGVPESNMWVTLERNMNCAIGLCGHCQLGPEFLCKDGPVFRYDRISDWFHVQGV